MTPKGKTLHEARLELFKDEEVFKSYIADTKAEVAQKVVEIIDKIDDERENEPPQYYGALSDVKAAILKEFGQ